MVFFKNKDVEVFEEEENAELFGNDAYNHPNSGLVSKGTFDADFQPLSVNESLKTYGKFVQGAYVLYMDLGVPINSTCKVKVPGYEDYFQVNGEPRVDDDLLPGIKVDLQYEGVPQQ